MHLNYQQIIDVVSSITSLPMDEAYKIANDTKLINNCIGTSLKYLIEIQRRIKEDLADIYETE